MRADGFEVPHHADRVVIRKGDIFHVHNRRSEPAMHQYVANIMHVNKTIDVAITIYFFQTLDATLLRYPVQKY